MQTTTSPDYDHLYDTIAKCMSIRRLKPEPIPDDYVPKILEAGRWAALGANSQPWEFIVVKDESVKRALFEANRDVNSDFSFGWSRCASGRCGTQPIKAKVITPKSNGSVRESACPARGLRRPCTDQEGEYA